MTEGEIREEPESLETYALKLLKDGRQEWDVPHTLSVVHHIGELGEAVDLDGDVLRAAAYLHDTGYPKIDTEEGSVAVTDKKAYHMEEGARLAREFLDRSENLDRYSPEQRELIIRLVGNHDRLSTLDPNDLYAVVIMEADTLGMIDYSRATPTFNRVDGMRFIQGVKTRRAPLFQTALGKQRLAELLPQAEAYFTDLPEEGI